MEWAEFTCVVGDVRLLLCVLLPKTDHLWSGGGRGGGARGGGAGGKGGGGELVPVTAGSRLATSET